MSQFVWSCMFLIFTIYAFTHLELVASDTGVIKKVCDKTMVEDCINILMSDPRSSNATNDIELGLAIINMTISRSRKARDRTNVIIGLTRDSIDVKLLKECTQQYDIIVDEMVKSRPLLQSKTEKERWGPASDALAYLQLCDTDHDQSQSDYKNELAGLNQDVRNVLQAFMSVVGYYDI